MEFATKILPGTGRGTAKRWRGRLKRVATVEEVTCPTRPLRRYAPPPRSGEDFFFAPSRLCAFA